MPNRKTRRPAYINLWLRKPSGLPRSHSYITGKTRQVIVEPSSAANALAERISSQGTAQEILRVNLSHVVSKYIGETEKNLRALFDKAENEGAILFFDEADALFGKRTSVRDSHDRYANKAAPLFKKLLKRYKGTAIIALNN